MIFLVRECYVNYCMFCDFVLIVYVIYKLKGEIKVIVGVFLIRVFFYINFFLGKKC